MAFRIVVWNSQGAKWDTFWDNWLAPYANGTGDDVAGMLVEAGWAPWVRDREVRLNSVYLLDQWMTYFDPAGFGASAFCRGVAAQRRRSTAWVPWVMNLDAMKTNTRCSIGAMVSPCGQQFLGYESVDFGLIRPVLVSSFGTGRTHAFAVVLVHLVSSARAAGELDALTTFLARNIPEKTPALIVGDMNINLRGMDMPRDPRWSVLRAGVPTQQSGGELDWALFYQPNPWKRAASAEVLCPFKTAPNDSDHSVMMYTLNL